MSKIFLSVSDILGGSKQATRAEPKLKCEVKLFSMNHTKHTFFAGSRNHFQRMYEY